MIIKHKSSSPLRKTIVFLFLIIGMFGNAQTKSVRTKIYDENGNVIKDGTTFFDKLGRQIQSQTRVKSDNNNVIVMQTLYDAYGRKVLETLPAPIGPTSPPTAPLTYKDRFIISPFSGQNYSISDFDKKSPTIYTGSGSAFGDALLTAIFGSAGMTNRPWGVSNSQMNTLGYYYSKNNAQEPFVPASLFPYSRVEYDDNNLGVVKRTSSAGEALRMGSNHEIQTYSMGSLNELDYLYGKNNLWVIENYVDNGYDGQGAITPVTISTPTNIGVMKTISVDQNGQETVVFTSPDGKILASCLSGQVNNLNVRTLQLSYRRNNIGSGGTENGSLFIDVHIPKGCENSLVVENTAGINDQNPLFKVFDFKSGTVLKNQNRSETFNQSQLQNLPAGYYRITWLSGGRRQAGGNLYFFAFKVTQNVNYYNFSINYYTKAGNLKAVVPPAGVDNNYIPSGIPPVHKMISSYDYNSLNQIISTITPDAGLSKFIYRDDGQIRFSQNANQRDPAISTSLQKFSYINYDNFGRVIESGEYDPSKASVGSPLSFSENYINSTLDNGRCLDQNYIMYDSPDISYLNYKQNFLLGQVSKTWNVNSATWYSYDELGRVVWTVQQINDMPFNGNSKYFTINYSYDFNGNVTQIAYQKEETGGEDFYHYYEYDADKRLKKVLTSPDGLVKQEQATYYYYKHGPLKRVELANKLQGIDYVYTINGLLKSVNSPELNGRDPGKDGTISSTNHVPKDLFGMALDYFDGDYVRPNTNIQTSSGGQNLYNGTIKAQRWQTQLPEGGITDPSIQHKNKQLYYQYSYDNKYQLKSALFGEINNLGSLNGNGVNVEFAPTLNAFLDYNVTIPDYDLNGNIKTMNRNGFGSVPMDQLTYGYGSGLNNQLVNVQDVFTSDNYSRDFEFIPNISGINYSYDKIGQQISDPNAGTVTTYNSQGNVTEINPDNSINYARFKYDEKGRRIKKSDIFKDTWYIRDATGNVVSIYETSGSPLIQTEVNLLGDNRLGVYHPDYDVSLYELNDHLGNVRATFYQSLKPDVSTNFDGTKDDYLFYSNPIDNTTPDVLHSGSHRFASVKLTNGSWGYGLLGIHVKQFQEISGSIWLLGNSQAKIYMGLTNSNSTTDLGFVEQAVNTSGGSVWVKNDFNFIAPVEGYFYFLVYNPQTGGNVWFDDLTVNFIDGGGIPVAHEVNFTDYYPHGSIMPGRSPYPGEYRYGYQGQFSEKDPETKLNSFEARMCDAVLGRWSAIDPANQYYSPYISMSNNPVSVTDPDGRYTYLYNSGFIIGAGLGGYQGYEIGKANGATGMEMAGYIVGGAAIGAVAGGAAASVSSSGMPFANTAAITSASYTSGVGFNMLSGGETAVNISFGAASFNVSSQKFGWLGKKGNSRFENMDYVLGGLANFSDIINYRASLKVLNRKKYGEKVYEEDFTKYNENNREKLSKTEAALHPDAFTGASGKNNPSLRAKNGAQYIKGQQSGYSYSHDIGYYDKGADGALDAFFNTVVLPEDRALLSGARSLSGKVPTIVNCVFTPIVGLKTLTVNSYLFSIPVR